MPCRYKAIPPAITSAPRISGASTHFANQTKDRVKRRTVSLDIRSSQRLRNREARYCRRGYYFTLHQCAGLMRTKTLTTITCGENTTSANYPRNQANDFFVRCGRCHAISAIEALDCP